jgi:hypothetical protein
LSRADATKLAPSQLEWQTKGFTANPDEHSAAVKSYFLSLGLPSSEIGGMHVTTLMRGGGSLAVIEKQKLEFVHYTSHMERFVGGVPVEGSHAYAAIDVNGDLIAESVLWPTIPQEIVANAIKLAKRLSTESEKADFLSTLRAVAPFDETSGQVKILHTSWTYRGAFEAHVVYDVLSPAGAKQHSIHFTESGEQFRMPEERASGLPDGQPAKVAPIQTQ